MTFYNREEATAVGTSFVISPNPPVPGFRLCGEASILTFNDTVQAGDTLTFTHDATISAGAVYDDREHGGEKGGPWRHPRPG